MAIEFGDVRLPPFYWEKVEIADNGCWNWRASILRGYGVFWERETRRSRRAHRVAYEFLIGPIPFELVLDHLCRNKACVNPAHLEAVSQHENVLRGCRWNDPNGPSRRRDHCPKGHPMSPENIYTHPSGWRQCRVCRRAERRIYKIRRRERERHHA